MQPLHSSHVMYNADKHSDIPQYYFNIFQKIIKKFAIKKFGFKIIGFVNKAHSM
jgi:hypothetical protein